MKRKRIHGKIPFTPRNSYSSHDNVEFHYIDVSQDTLEIHKLYASQRRDEIQEIVASQDLFEIHMVNASLSPFNRGKGLLEVINNDS